MATYFTPPKALEAVAGARPLDAILANPPFATREIFRYRDMKTLPRGIEMKEYVHADGSLTFVGQYYNTKNAQPNSRPKRVYRVEVLKIEPFGELTAAVFEDDVRLVKLGGGTSKWNLAYAALGALRGILHKRCTQTRTNKKLKKLAKSAEQNKEGV